MTGLKEKIATLLLFSLGICWGNFWTVQLLSCPEWWFAGVILLLTGIGFSAGKLLPENWRAAAGGLLPALLLIYDGSLWRNVLLAGAFGLWYAGDESHWQSWRVSRTFCGGLLIGGISAGYFIPGHLAGMITGSILMFCGFLRLPRPAWLEIIPVIAIYCLFFPQAAPENRIAPPDTGSVISAFSLLPENPEKTLPKVVFVGGSSLDHYQSSAELYPAADLHFLPGMPGTFPLQSDLITVVHVPGFQPSGAAALKKYLQPDGILVMPEQYWKYLPGQTWQILPGSDGKYAATVFNGKLQLEPQEMDKQLSRHYRHAKKAAPLSGALAGMLVDFRPGEIHIPSEKVWNFYLFIAAASTAVVLMAAMGVIQAGQQKRECFRIILNCTGFIMLAALTLPRIFAGLPTVSGIRAVVIAGAFMWIFRRPFKRNKHDRYIWFAGLLSLIALFCSWSGNWIFSLAALIFGGYAFAALDDELFPRRSFSTEPLRFFALALGALAVWYLQACSIPETTLFFAVAFMRFWSWFRS